LRDVKKNHLISALLVVAQRQLDGIPDIAQFTRLGFAEVNASRDLAGMNIQARYDTFRYHSADMEPFYRAGCNIFHNSIAV
jgi:hypothetical protein